MGKGKFRPRITRNDILDRSLQDVYAVLNSIYDEFGNAINSVSNTLSTSAGSSGGAAQSHVVNITYADFPIDSSILNIGTGAKVKKIYIEIVTAFDAGTISIADSVRTLVNGSYVIMDALEPQEWLILKTYTTDDNLLLSSIGSPSAGELNITIEYIGA